MTATSAAAPPRVSNPYKKPAQMLRTWAGNPNKGSAINTRGNTNSAATTTVKGRKATS